jgi:outer membrane scaffolding protein for murein synthesis (MipA/OmpV family)
MKNHRVLMILLVGVFMFSLSGAVQVQANDGGLSLGLGVGVAPDYIGSDDYTAVPMVYGKMTCPEGNYYLELAGKTLKANLVNHDLLVFGPLVNYRFGRDDAISIDDSAVEKMDSVDDSFEVGAFLGLRMDEWAFMAEAFKDVSDGHDGLLVTLSGKYVWDLSSSWDLIIGGSTTWADSDYMDAFFSVDPGDAIKSGLHLYNAGSQWRDVSCDLGAVYRCNEEWKIRLSGGWTRLLSDAKNSPVTDDRGDQNQFFAGIMGIYTFW